MQSLEILCYKNAPIFSWILLLIELQTDEDQVYKVFGAHILNLTYSEPATRILKSSFTIRECCIQT